MRRIDGSSSLRLSKEWKASVEIPKDLNILKKGGSLELRVYNKYPECALIIGDGGKLQCNVYPTEEKKDMADSQLPRGVSGETYIYDIGSNPNEFEIYINYFNNLWEGADAKNGKKYLS